MSDTSPPPVDMYYLYDIARVVHIDEESLKFADEQSALTPEPTCFKDKREELKFKLITGGILTATLAPIATLNSTTAIVAGAGALACAQATKDTFLELGKFNRNAELSKVLEHAASLTACMAFKENNGEKYLLTGKKYQEVVEALKNPECIVPQKEKAKSDPTINGLLCHAAHLVIEDTLENFYGRERRNTLENVCTARNLLQFAFSNYYTYTPEETHTEASGLEQAAAL